MLNFFKFLLKHNFVFVFLLLEALALWLIVSTNDHQRAIAGSFVTEVEGRMFSVSSNFSNFFKLKSTNKILQEENAYLRSLLPESYRDNYQLEFTQDSMMFINDTVNGSTDEINNDVVNDTFNDNLLTYKYIPAQVINSSMNKRNNHIVINKGKRDGVEVNMGVISPSSVVGVVTDVSQHYATVLPVLHSRSKVSVKLKNDNEFGVVSWNGVDFRKGDLSGIPLHAKIANGDTVVTSGRTQRYPYNIPVGIIDDYSSTSGNGFYDIVVSFVEDYRKLNVVYVIDNLYKQELDSLFININE